MRAGRRRAARRARRRDGVTFVVNRNINFTNVCVVGCAFCGFGQGKRSPDAYHVDRGRLRRPGRRRRSTSARPRSACRAASTPTTRSRTTGAGCGSSKEVAPQIHLHAYSPMEVHFMCERSGTLARGGVRLPDRVRARARRPGPRPRCSHDGVRQRISPNKLPVDRWVEIIEACAPRRPALDLDGDVRPHRGAVGAGASTCASSASFRSGPAGSPSSCRSASSPSTRCSGRTHGVEEISRDENLKHTAAFRLALGRTITQPAGELGEDGPRRRDREPALGRQRPRRDADGGEHLPHGRLAPRRPAGARRS